MQNRTAVKRIIREATAAGELDTLCYYVEMTVPKLLQPVPGASLLPATDPPGQIPVVPLSPDPEAAGHYAHLLQAILEDANRGRGITFSVELTSYDVMEGFGLRWYAWGESPAVVDVICPRCGAISQVIPGQDAKCCEVVELPAGAGFYSGQWWGGMDAPADQ